MVTYRIMIFEIRVVEKRMNKRPLYEKQSGKFP